MAIVWFSSFMEIGYCEQRNISIFNHSSTYNNEISVTLWTVKCWNSPSIAN